MHQDDPRHDECIRTIEYVTDLLRAIQFQNTDECLVLLLPSGDTHCALFCTCVICKLELKVFLLLLIAISASTNRCAIFRNCQFQKL